MQQEAEITVNGTNLTNDEARVVRVALATLADALSIQLEYKDNGIPLTDQYQTDVANVRALIDGRMLRSQ
jgi:hypothetical protein